MGGAGGAPAVPSHRHRSRSRFVIPGIVAGAMILGVVVLSPRIGARGATTCAPIVGRCAPPFRLLDTNNRPVTLAQFRGKGVVLNFWAVSCPPCWQEEPALKRAARENASRGVVMLGIDAWAEPGWLVRSYLRHDPFPYTVLLDPGQIVSNKYNGWRTPETIFVDSRGQVTGLYLGPIPYRVLDAQIDRIRPAA